MDDQDSRRPGRRPDDDRAGDEWARDADPEYSWGGKPGEDFGPIAPPGSPRPLNDETAQLGPLPTRQTARRPSVTGAPLRPDGVFTPPARRRRPWGAILAMLVAMVALGGLAVAAVYVISGRPIPGVGQTVPWLGQATPMSTPAAAAVPSAPAVPSPAAAARPAVTAAPSPAPAGSPTPLTIGAPPSPAPVRSPTAVPGVRLTPAILPTPPALVTPPGLRFPTSTPARIGSPQSMRTPPPIPSPRLPTISTRVWSEQIIHKVGDNAAICAQTSQGASAQLMVIAPDRAPRTLAEFSTPSDRVCHTLNVDQPDLWVLTLIIRDADVKEIDRQSAALWVSR